MRDSADSAHGKESSGWQASWSSRQDPSLRPSPSQSAQTAVEVYRCAAICQHGRRMEGLKEDENARKKIALAIEPLHPDRHPQDRVALASLQEVPSRLDLVRRGPVRFRKLAQVEDDLAEAFLLALAVLEDDFLLDRKSDRRRLQFVLAAAD